MLYIREIKQIIKSFQVLKTNWNCLLNPLTLIIITIKVKNKKMKEKE